MTLHLEGLNDWKMERFVRALESCFSEGEREREGDTQRDREKRESELGRGDLTVPLL